MAILSNAEKEETRGAWTSAQVKVRIISPRKEQTVISPLPNAPVPNARTQTNLVFRNFDVAVSRNSDGYLVSVVQSLVGEASTSFRLRFDDNEWKNLCTLMKISERDAGSFFVDRIDEQNSDASNQEQPQSFLDAQRFGSCLFTSLFHSDIENMLARSLDRVKEQGCGLRIRLNFSEASELWRLPWELLYDLNNKSFLSLQKTISIERYVNLPRWGMRIPTDAPWHMLAVTPMPTDRLKLNLEEEWRTMQEALSPLIERQRLILTRLSKPTLRELESALHQQDYDILHFAGHGEFNESAGTSTLIFENEGSRLRKVSSEQVAELLLKNTSLRLAVFNAVNSGELCQRLVQQRIPAAIGAQFEFSDQEAIKFARNFYGAIAEGYSAESALAEARVNWLMKESAQGWASPVLYTSSSSEHIVPSIIDSNV